MAILKGINRQPRGDSLSKGIMVDTVRGVLRVRKWPKKRGTPTSASQLYWIDWFRQANKLAKYVDAATARRAIELTAGSGMYPRDIILSSMRGRLYSWVDQNGKKWRSMAAIQDISDSLDILNQNIGSILVRTAERWNAIAPGLIGQSLVSAGPGVVPAFASPAGTAVFGGGCLLTLAANYSIPTNTQAPIPFTVEQYDTGGFHDNAVNPSRITVPAGYSWAQLTSSVRFAHSTVGIRISEYWKNGVWLPGSVRQENPASHGVVGQASTTCVVACVEGDYFEFVPVQASGGNLNLEKINDLTCFGAQFWV